MRTIKLIHNFALLLIVTAGTTSTFAQIDNSIGLRTHASFANSDIDHVDLATGNIVGIIPLVSYPQLGNLPALSFSAISNTNAWRIEGTCDPYGDMCVDYYVADPDSDNPFLALGFNIHSNLEGLKLSDNIFNYTAVRFNLVASPSSSKPSMVYSDFRVSTI